MTTTARRLTKKGQATRDRIVGAAAQLMLEQGVARTTIEDIQAAAGVSPSQLYHYFPGKDALVSAVVDHQASQVLHIHQACLQSVDSIDSLRQWRDVMVNIITEMHCVGGCPLGSLASDLSDADPLARTQLAAAFSRWQELIRQGLADMQQRGELAADANPGELAVAMLAAVQGGLLLSQVNRDPAPLRIAVDTMIDHLHNLTRTAIP
ncbi:TetR/AcrR family transcriptional regulator [Kribbella sp. NPDC048915]|uniref:TetR/AcrR family transcriptional regulator n=1 Tax=Kribbella sp. NPDC048915 TaxID=3155148 RepID=UPI0033DD7C0F